MYDKLAGMTGTALTEANEFMKIYKLPVVAIPTNRPMVRDDRNDSIYKTKEGKWSAVEREIAARHEAGQPVLVGTISVEVSELLSQRLERRGIPHSVLNAKPEFAEREGETIAEAGRAGAVTIATNMAGRGVDIKLGGNAEHLTQVELAKLGLKPGDPDFQERFDEILPTFDARVAEAREQVMAAGGLCHHRHRAPRVAPHRQPAPRPRRPPGRPGQLALLPVRRGRPRAAVRRRPHLPHPRPLQGRRRRGQRGADRGRASSPSRSRTPSARSRSSTTSSASTRSSTTT